jgi:hypothetical protein
LNLQKPALIIVFISFIIAFCVNEINLKQIISDKLETRENETILTADDYAYLRSFDIYEENNSFYFDDFDKHLTVIRTPGYGFNYFVFKKLFGLKDGLKALKIWQTLLFSISIYCLFFISYYLFKNTFWAIIFTSIYGLLPFSMGFLYYTLTEAISPSLTIIFIFLLFKAQKSTTENWKIGTYVLSSIIFSYLFLTRPVLGIFILALPSFVLLDNFKSQIPRFKIYFLMILLSISFLFTGIWQFRNYQIFGKLIGLHPIYQNEFPGTFRPSHDAMWQFFKGWESSGENFHSTTLPIWNAAIKGDTSSKHIDEIIEKIPKFVTTKYGKDRIYQTFKAYQTATLVQKPFYENRQIMPSTLSDEEKYSSKLFYDLEKDFKRDFWFVYHVKTPLLVLKNLAFHSNLSLYIFQHTYRGNFLIEALRIICFAIHSLAFISIFLAFLLYKNPAKIIVFFFIPFIYIFYLIYFQRGIEERYTLPFLFIAVLNLFLFLKIGISKILK